MATRDPHELLAALGEMIGRVARGTDSQAAMLRITVTRGEAAETMTLPGIEEALAIIDSIEYLTGR